MPLIQAQSAIKGKTSPKRIPAAAKGEMPCQNACALKTNNLQYLYP